jgi:cytochrome c oxidase assembly factor CtaG
VAATWSISPLWAPGLLLVVLEWLGVRRLAARSAPRRAARWRWRACSFSVGIVLVCGIDSSPLMGSSMEHLSLHMALHVVEMFYVPILLLLGAPGLAFAFAFEPGVRRRWLRWWHLGRHRRAARWAGAVLGAPVLAVVAFNGVMVLWHLPVVFDWASQRAWAHTWLMTPSFVLAGYAFWRLILPSGPWPARASTRLQVLAVVATAATMLVLAIALGVLSRSAWYSTYVTALGPSAAFSDQQLAAGILWICGDFWVAPALLIIGRRIIGREGSLSAAFERTFGTGAA